jgi:hypothetical protein
METGLQEPVRKQVKEDGRKMERPENGTERNKEGQKDREMLTHPKPPHAAPGDLGQVTRTPLPRGEGGGDPDSGGSQQGAGQGSA